MHANVTITHYVSQALILVIIKHVFCFLHISRKDNYNSSLTRLRMCSVFQTEQLRLVSKYNSSFIFYTYIENELRIFRQAYPSIHIFFITIFLSWLTMNLRRKIIKRRFLKTNFFLEHSSKAYIDIRHYISFNVEEKLGVHSTISLTDRKI